MANVHIGNVVEFNAPSLPRGLDVNILSDRLAGCDEYASLAPFYTDDPGLVLIPRAGQADLDRWAEVQCKVLGWSAFEPAAWQSDSASLSADLSQDARVMAAVAAGKAIIPWGETGHFRTFVQQTGAKAKLSIEPTVAGRVDSKFHQIELFAASYLDLARPDGIEIAAQSVANNDHELVAAILKHGRAGRPVVIKSPRGVGGNGSAVLRPHQTVTESRCLRALSLARENDGFLKTTPLIVQNYYWKKARWGDLTSDFEIDDVGKVHCRGSALMLLDGTHYVGAGTIDTPSPEVKLAERFGAAVGERLATEGYRGWFDVDYLQSLKGTLVPLEVNARRTGPTIAFSIQSAVATRRGTSVCVAVHDALPLPKRMKAATASEWFRRAAEALGLAGDLVPTLTTATSGLTPYLGAAVIGPSTEVALTRLAALRDTLLN